MNTQTFETYESQVRSYCRHFPAVFTKARGAKMFDEDGNEYIDFFCGAGALNYGHNNPYIKEKMVEYLLSDGILHSMDMYTAPKRAFFETLQERILKPRGYDYKIMCCGPTGTNGVEAALKLARKVTGRTNVFAFMGCFHGMSMGALSLTTERYARDGAGVPLNNVTHIPAPYMFPGLDVIEYMQRLLDDDHSGISKPAALVMETVQAEGGIHPFSPEFLQACRKFCDDNGILLIVDDIQAGIGRTGTFFSFERAGIVPDMVTLSKSIGGCGFPLSMVLFKPELDKWVPGQHTGTFRGNQLSLIAGKAGLEMFVEGKMEEETKRKAEIFRSFLENEILPMDSRLSYRGIGMIWGLDFSKFEGDMTKPLIAACFQNGLILERVGRDNNVLKLMPPVIIPDDQLLEGLQILKKSLAAIL